MFWGKVNGLNSDYYIALGISYSERYEFPEKKFYWCCSSDMTFVEFPALNKQHETLYDSLSTLNFTGDPKLIHEKVEQGNDSERKREREERK